MANYHLEFSQYLENITPEEKDWLSKELDTDKYKRLECDGAKAKYALHESFGEFGCTGFAWTFEVLPQTKLFNLWIHADESGIPEAAANLVQAFLKEFRPEDYWCLEFSQTCSRPRIGAFGGGAVFVTATDQAWLSTGAWVEVQARDYKKGDSDNG